MRRFLLAAVMGWIASGAYAADLPVLRGGLTDGLSTSSVTWQGFYVGGQIGYGSSDEHFAGSNADMISAISH
jgi:outer membrane immunogenic protein